MRCKNGIVCSTEKSLGLKSTLGSHPLFWEPGQTTGMFTGLQGQSSSEAGCISQLFLNSLIQLAAWKLPQADSESLCVCLFTAGGKFLEAMINQGIWTQITLNKMIICW